MVVVDDPGLGLQIAMELAEVGCTVDLAGTPTRARELAARRAYDVVVVDLRLSEGEGPTPAERRGPVLLTIGQPPGNGRGRAIVDVLDEIFEPPRSWPFGTAAGHARFLRDHEGDVQRSDPTRN